MASSKHRCCGMIYLGPTWPRNIRCSRIARIEHKDKWYCRAHAPVITPIEDDVYEDTIRLCACGCGEPVNLLFSAFATAKMDGLNHREIGELYGYDRSYVGRLLSNPPRFKKGHAARAYWLTDEGHERRVAWLKELERRRISVAETMRARRLARDRRQEREQERERERLLVWRFPSLDAPLWSQKDQEGSNSIEIHSLHPGGDDPADLYERARIRELLGSLDVAEVEMMGEHELVRLREKLLAEGIGPGIVQHKERERLRQPQQHSGSAIGKAGGHGGGRRNRKQQQAVTKEHHVRELPTHAKKAHALLRKAKRAA